MSIVRIAIIAVLAVGVAACSKGESSNAPAPSPPAKVEPGSPAPTPPTTAADPIASVMEPYELCRALLAADRLEGVGACAADLQRAGNAGADQPDMRAIATAAGALAAASELDAARLAFGEVSKGVVALLSSSPGAAAAYHVFECPMAKGFKQWVQPSAELANPYMGTAMLTCGSEVAKP